MTLLATKTLYLGDRDALYADLRERFTHVIEFERLDNGSYKLHVGLLMARATRAPYRSDLG